MLRDFFHFWRIWKEVTESGSVGSVAKIMTQNIGPKHRFAKRAVLQCKMHRFGMQNLHDDFD